MTLEEKKDMVRTHRNFKTFDAKVMECLSQDKEIPQDWKDFGKMLRDATDNVDDYVSVVTDDNGITCVNCHVPSNKT
jgi:formate-dependent nitrite reductase cytochrome c552 subunit